MEEIYSSLHVLNKTNWKTNIGELAKKLKSMTPPTPTPKQNDSLSTHESSNDSPKSLNAKESNSDKNKMPKEERKRPKTILEQLSNSPKTKKSKTLVTGNAQKTKFQCANKRSTTFDSKSNVKRCKNRGCHIYTPSHRTLLCVAFFPRNFEMRLDVIYF